ncbi:MAG: hypothetical protein EB101_08775 [Chitinophagia bacterium]|nr:hypothetical protein [Chitinophagia bacterium]
MSPDRKGRQGYKKNYQQAVDYLHLSFFLTNDNK